MTQNLEILLVEDNPNDLELTLHAFEKRRLTNKIHIARDGEEALDFLFQNGKYVTRKGMPNPRLILLDLKLPKVDGIEVLRQLKARPETRNIPVVVLTTSKEDLDIVRSYELGVNSYIAKPVDFAKFTEAVEQVQIYWLLLNEAPVPKE